jgi:hypothetical protein
VTASFSETTVTKQEEGPPLAAGPSITTDFWEYLRSWGGEWMWEGVDDNQVTKHDLTWLVEGMTSGLLIWVTDGSYNKLKAPDVSGAGWIFFCTTTGKRLTGWFWEVSNTASSYQAEMLVIIIIIIVITLPLGLSAFGKEGVIPIFQKTH